MSKYWLRNKDSFNSMITRFITLCVLSTSTYLTASELFSWQSEQCDQECPGEWIITEEEPEFFRKKQMQINVFKQRFDFKKKIMTEPFRKYFFNP